MVDLGHVDYSKDWIIDFGCSNHMTSDKEKLQNVTIQRRVSSSDCDSRLLIAHVDNTTIVP